MNRYKILAILTSPIAIIGFIGLAPLHFLCAGFFALIASFFYWGYALFTWSLYLPLTSDEGVLWIIIFALPIYLISAIHVFCSNKSDVPVLYPFM